MCDACMESYGAYEPGVLTDEVRRVAGMIHRFYQLDDCITGGPLHIVLDDVNVEDDHIDWCLANAVPEPDWSDEVRTAALAIAEALRPLTLAQRARATDYAHETPAWRPIR